MKSRSAWFENGTEKARKLKKENSKRLIKSAILGNADIFVVRKSYNSQKAQDKGVLVRDYKKIKNILMGTPASGSAKRVW